jgi:altronate dehydratase small subunit
MDMNKLLIMNKGDNVGVCLADGKTGEKVSLKAKDGVESGTINLEEDTPFAHKVALIDISQGEKIIKYGETIGAATQAIKAGHWVHTHNMKGLRGKGGN